jgi:16S rRNA (guanine966-N2)-methyltransferase
MRVIAGSARGRRLQAPPGRATRPTSDRVREALFSSISDRVPGAVVLDLFAGTGALGIEALSRGAGAATFVEREPAVLTVLRANLDTAGVAERAEVVRSTAEAFAGRAAGVPYDLVLCDPPYDYPTQQTVDLLLALRAAGALASDAVIVLERDKRDPAVAAAEAGDAALDAAGVLAIDRHRSYGDTVLLYLRAVAAFETKDT